MRRLIAALTVVGLISLPACTSSDSKGGTSSAPSSSAGDLAGKLAVGGITSAKVGIKASLLGQNIAGSGPATFADGALTGFDVQGDVPGIGKLRLLLASGKVYAQLPASLNSSGKPWVIVTADSKNAIVGQLGGVLDQIQSAASLTNLAELTKAATKVTDKGTEDVNGVSAHHYSFVVDADKLPPAFPGRSDLGSEPLKGKVTDIWLDDKGRPVKVARPVLVSGSPIDLSLTLGDFNSSVTITAPPAGDVATI